MAAVASYLLGDSVTQFSTIIGVYLSALGGGAYLSRFVDKRLALTFVDVELGAALVGGLSAPALFLAFSYTESFRFILYGFVVGVGLLVGLELPLLIRILRQQVEFKELIAKALTFDYAGALAGSLAFSFLLVPYLGLIHTSLLSGLLNSSVALASTWLLPADDETEKGGLAAGRARAVVVTLLLLVTLAMGGRITDLAEAGVYSDPVIYAEQSNYQRIVLTRRGDNLRLHLNGNLQFSSKDEHRYHEALVHPALATAASRRSVFIGGGGDGLGAREVLEWADVEKVTLVDLDPAITMLARRHDELRALNAGSLDDPRVEVVNSDAFVWLANAEQKFDVVILDFPDPSNYSLGKLYSRRFYKSVRDHLETGGALVVQSTSPLFARRAFWCVVETIESVGFHTRPYHTFVPSFSEWGYVLAKLEPFEEPRRVPPGLRFLDEKTMSAMFRFSADMTRVPAEVNRLDNQAIVSYYLRAWDRWN